MDRNFTFKNCTPKSMVEQSCRILYDIIWKRSPSDSSITATVEKKNDDVYTANIEVHSQCGKFRSSATHSSMATAADFATSRILDVFAEWRVRRFSDQQSAVVG